jgi:hypothetical protein
MSEAGLLAFGLPEVGTPADNLAEGDLWAAGVSEIGPPARGIRETGSLEGLCEARSTAAGGSGTGASARGIREIGLAAGRVPETRLRVAGGSEVGLPARGSREIGWLAGVDDGCSLASTNSGGVTEPGTGRTTPLTRPEGASGVKRWPRVPVREGFCHVARPLRKLSARDSGVVGPMMPGMGATRCHSWGGGVTAGDGAVARLRNKRPHTVFTSPLEPSG